MEEVTDSELIRYFNAEVNIEERERIEAWMSRSAENRALANDVYTIFLACDTLETVRALSPDEALKKVNKRIYTYRFRQYGTWMQRVAAILFIPLLLAASYLLLKDMNSVPENISFRTNPGIIADFNLPDGTKVWLNSYSSLTYPANFKGGVREVKLSGEAYFQVKKDEKHPFIVKLSNDVEIEVTGTEFNIDAYEKSKVITAMLVSGGVRMKYPYEMSRERESVLQPGQKIIFDKETGKAIMTRASALVETGWKDGKIFLEDTPLEHLLYTLSKRFSVDFVLENKRLEENRFTGVFGAQDMDMILRHLEVSSGIKHRIKIPANDDAEARTVVFLY